MRNHRLWPRSMVQPPLTEGDKKTFDRLARMEVRRPEFGVKVVFHEEADHDPLHAHLAGARPAAQDAQPAAQDVEDAQDAEPL